MGDRPPIRSRFTVPERAGVLLLLLIPITPLSLSDLAGQSAAEPSASASCPRAASMLFGEVRDGGSDLLLPGAQVRLVWKHARGVADTVRGQIETTADERGVYLFCDLPAETLLDVWASALGRTGSPASLYLSGGQRERRDLHLRLEVSARGALAGSLLDTESGESLRAARLSIPRLDDVETLTDAEGSFRLAGLPGGHHELKIEHIGFGEQTVSVEIVPNRTRYVNISLKPDPIELEPIAVTIDMRPVWLESVGFYERRAKSLGQFMGPEWMERRNPYRFSQVLENVPGLRIAPMCRPHCSYWVQTTTASGFCPPVFFIDGRRLRLGSLVDLDALVPAGDVAAVEVYRGISQTPAQYYGQCGSIVIWTKRG